MKDLSLLVWLTQLGLSVAVPPVMFILLAVWLRDSLGWGAWVIWVGIGLGIYCAVYGLYTSLKTLKRLTEGKKEDPPAAFNEHE
ncbi:MAG: AtpZ/AtpI family protein [Ruminococcaceae bacterium]|nr:AtpZ/AtpI family protein [Oscillospiraceae bacterium]